MNFLKSLDERNCNLSVQILSNDEFWTNLKNDELLPRKSIQNEIHNFWKGISEIFNKIIENQTLIDQKYLSQLFDSFSKYTQLFHQSRVWIWIKNLSIYQWMINDESNYNIYMIGDRSNFA
jgi:hypothetical protein